MNTTSPALTASISPATRIVPLPSSTTNISSCAWCRWYGQPRLPGATTSMLAPSLSAAVPRARRAPLPSYSGARVSCVERDLVEVADELGAQFVGFVGHGCSLGCAARGRVA